MHDNERTPPTRIRLTGLQEAQVAPLVELDAACSSMYYELGFDAAEVPTRTAADFVALARNNSVRVAEADHEVAGFIAWHDEAPGVGYVTELAVHPEMQRFGVGAALLEAVRAEARSLGLHELIVRCWEKATWAMAFYRREQFQPVDESAPGKVRGWCEAHAARPLTRPGEVLLWAPVGELEAEDPDAEGDDDGALLP